MEADIGLEPAFKFRMGECGIMSKEESVRVRIFLS